MALSRVHTISCLLTHRALYEQENSIFKTKRILDIQDMLGSVFRASIDNQGSRDGDNLGNQCGDWKQRSKRSSIFLIECVNRLDHEAQNIKLLLPTTRCWKLKDFLTTFGPELCCGVLQGMLYKGKCDSPRQRKGW